jgi:hypothetical protein
MTIYVQQGPVVGQPMSPNFGAQNGLGATPVVSQPTTAPTAGGMQATGVQMSLLEACSRGLIPRNNMVTAAGGVSTGAQNPTPVDDCMSNGCGAQLNLGVAVAPNANNPNSVTTAGVNNQIFVEGIAGNGDGISTGPIPTNIETYTSAPIPASATTANVTLGAGQFQG